MAEQHVINIDPLSASSLRIKVMVNGNVLSTATGFVVAREGKNYLVTNWHVVAGRDPDTGQVLSSTAGIPDSLRIIHHSEERLGSWVITLENLYNNGRPRWLEHPEGQRVDVVAIPLSEGQDRVKLYPLDLSLGDVDIVPEPGMTVLIIGYPYGLATGDAWPIWKTGHIASDPDIDYDGRPVFLIDATTREGMSGSPVVLRPHGGYRTRDRNYVMAGGSRTRFLGVYAGRIHGQAEIGRVWRPHLISKILENVGP